jgi:hypothetical protein
MAYCSISLHLLNLHNVLSPSILLHKLLRIKDDASIEHLMCIIELEANSLHVDQPVNIAQDEPTNQHLNGEERFRKKL